MIVFLAGCACGFIAGAVLEVLLDKLWDKRTPSSTPRLQEKTLSGAQIVQVLKRK